MNSDIRGLNIYTCLLVTHSDPETCKLQVYHPEKTIKPMLPKVFLDIVKFLKDFCIKGCKFYPKASIFLHVYD